MSLGEQVLALGLGIDRHEQHDFLVGLIEVDHAGAARLASTFALSANPTSAIGARDHFPRIRVCGDPGDQAVALGLGPDTLGLLQEGRGFDHGPDNLMLHGVPV
jgi:hypothetical protein